MEVDIFIPCFIDQIYPETGFNLVKVLEKLGVHVNYNTEQTCCGQPSFNSGYWDETKEIAEKFLSNFLNDRPIVSPSASCTGFVKKYYDELFKDTILYHNYKKVSKNLYEVTDFIVNVLKKEDIGASWEGIVTYHDSCASLREYKLNDEPRRLLRKVKGLKLVEMDETDTCCGFGGTFAVKHEPISTAMAEQKVNNALKTGADYIVSTDTSCLMHIEGYIKKHNIKLKTKHIVDILAEGI
ncbi:MAG: (Fe-S)-binding protein [Chlorobi bacterium]|nr:(Fe-S)-binding protein [Chlorobiota bacterium]